MTPRHWLVAGLLAPAFLAGCDQAVKNVGSTGGNSDLATSAPPPMTATGHAEPPPAAAAGRITPLGPVVMLGKVAENEDISGVVLHGDFMLLVSDETAHVEILKKDGEGYQPLRTVSLGAGELDLEALARDGDMIYAAGSHSRIRPKIKKSDDYATIRRKLTEINLDPTRDLIARFRLNSAGEAGPVETISLRTAIAASPELKPFADLPGKENGVDIEGLAVREGKLYVGFRSPVLRANYLPIMVTQFDHPEQAEIRFVNLDGLGIRDLAATQDGFLILAGPAGEGSGAYQVFAWDGYDCLTGATPQGRCQRLGEFPAMKGKPEGLTVLAETPEAYEILLVSDGVKNGQPTRYRVPRK
jgi:hypothetical protein